MTKININKPPTEKELKDMERKAHPNLVDKIAKAAELYDGVEISKEQPKKDILREKLINKMKTQQLDSDEIQYLMDTKDRSELKQEKLDSSAQRILTKPNNREARYQRKPTTWQLMKQTADPKELKELNQIEEKQMKKKNNTAYQVAMTAHDAIIKASMETLNKPTTQRKEPEVDQLDKIIQESNRPDPDVQRGLGNLIKQFDLKKMKPNLVSSGKFKKY